MVKRIILLIPVIIAIGSYLLCPIIFASSTAADLQPTSKANTNDAKNTLAGSSTQNPSSSSGPTNLAVTTTLEVNAAVPTDFTRTILINFNSGDSESSENVMIRLESINGYLYTTTIKPGTYKLDFINIVGEDASSYDITASDQFIVSKGDVAPYKLQIAYAPKQSPLVLPSQEAVSEEEQRVPEKPSVQPEREPNFYAVNGTATQKAIDERTTSLQEKAVLPQVESKKDTEGLRLLFLIIPVLFIVLLFFLYKQVQYKHDYYDC